jgi:serine/threonine-protein kinase
MPSTYRGRLNEKYALVRKLGTGKTSTVYEAEHLVVRKRVAVKLLHTELASDIAARDRFAEEARITALASHPNVVDVHDHGVSLGGTPYIVMELLRGETLEQLIERRGRLSAATACGITMQILAALGAAHQRGVVHRDVRPGNVFITYPKPDKALVKLLDFGVAAGVGVMNPSRVKPSVYTSPEERDGMPPDGRADIYSTGVVLYEMLMGEPPAPNMSGRHGPRTAPISSIAVAYLNGAAPKALAVALVAAMASERNRRFSSAYAFSVQLEPFVAEPPPHSVPRAEEAFLLRAASEVPEIRLISEPPPTSRTRVPQWSTASEREPDGSLSDERLFAPAIPKPPAAPDFVEYPASGETERWTGAPSNSPDTSGIDDSWAGAPADSETAADAPTPRADRSWPPLASTNAPIARRRQGSGGSLG